MLCLTATWVRSGRRQSLTSLICSFLADFSTLTLLCRSAVSFGAPIKSYLLGLFVCFSSCVQRGLSLTKVFGRASPTNLYEVLDLFVSWLPCATRANSSQKRMWGGGDFDSLLTQKYPPQSMPRRCFCRQGLQILGGGSDYLMSVLFVGFIAYPGYVPLMREDNVSSSPSFFLSRCLSLFQNADVSNCLLRAISVLAAYCFPCAFLLFSYLGCCP